MSSIKIVKDSLFYGLVPKLTIFISVFTLPLITPYLTTYDYGISGVLSSYSSFMIAVLPLGLHVHLTNSFFELPRHYNLVWGRVLYLMLLSSVLFGVLNFLILSFTLPIPFSADLLLLCSVGTIPVLYTSNSILANHLFPLHQKPQPLVLTNLLGSIVNIVLSFILIYFFHLGYWGLIVPNVLSGLIVYSLFVKFVWIDYDIKPIVDYNIKRIKWMLKVGLPLVPHALGFVFLTSSARIVMSQLNVSYDEIGLFSHGCTMGDYAVMVTTALITAISPHIQRAYRNHDYVRYRRLYYLCQSVALVTSVLVCIWIPEIYELLIKNEDLRLSSSIASLMCFSNVVFAFYVFQSTPVFIEKDTIQLLWLVFVPGFLNIVFCLIGITFFGYRAAIYSTIISYWSQLLIPFFVSYYHRNVMMWLGSLNKVIFVFLILLFGLIGSQFVSGFSISLKILFTLFLTILFCVVYKKKRMSELVS